MRPLSAAELLSMYERGSVQPPTRKALMLLSAACPEMSPEVIARLNLGRRDALLLTLRERLFGSEFACLATCPDCSAPLEVNFTVRNIRAEAKEEPEELLLLAIEGYEVRFRLPDSNDLLVITGNHNLAESQSILLSRCLQEIKHHDEEHSVEHLPAAVIGAIMERMALLDPQANIELNLTCPTCSHNWSAVFDIVSYLWNEIAAWAQHLLRDIHILASTYGWRESEILAMSAQRRQSYLSLIQGS